MSLPTLSQVIGGSFEDKCKKKKKKTLNMSSNENSDSKEKKKRKGPRKIKGDETKGY